jgi:hypothetical protein
MTENLMTRIRAERRAAEERLQQTDANGNYSWEPRYGFTSRDRVQLAAAIEAVRRRICIYGSDPCDCKYGIGISLVDGKPSSEASGCPELRSAVLELLHPAPAEAAS